MGPLLKAQVLLGLPEQRVLPEQPRVRVPVRALQPERAQVPVLVQPEPQQGQAQVPVR